MGTRFVLVTFLATVTKIPHTSNLKEESFYLCSWFLGIQFIVVAGEAGSALGLRELAVCSTLRPVDQEGRKPGLE